MLPFIPGSPCLLHVRSLSLCSFNLSAHFLISFFLFFLIFICLCSSDRLIINEEECSRMTLCQSDTTCSVTVCSTFQSRTLVWCHHLLTLVSPLRLSSLRLRERTFCDHLTPCMTMKILLMVDHVWLRIAYDVLCCSNWLVIASDLEIVQHITAHNTAMLLYTQINKQNILW